MSEDFAEWTDPLDPNDGRKDGVRASPSYAEIKYRKRILNAAYAEIYVASNIYTYWWPWRLQKPAYAGERVRHMANSGYILDSGIGDDVSNQEVIDTAADLRASYVIAKDYLDDPDASVNSVLDFLDTYDDHPTVESRVIVPLQRPHVESFDSLDDHGVFDHPDVSRVALGGLAPYAPDVQVRALRQFHEGAGRRADLDVHALGMGASTKLVRAVRDNPDLIDSLDLSTPEQMAKNSRYPGERWEQNDGYVVPGERSGVFRGLVSAVIATRLAYEMSPLPDVEKDSRLDVDDGVVQATLGGENRV